MFTFIASATESASHIAEFSWGAAWLPLTVFVVVYFLLASELVEKSVAAILGATILIMAGSITWDAVENAIELNVLFLLIGMMASVAILAETGFFEFVAIWIAKKAKGRAGYILVLMMVLTMVSSALLDNVTTIILLAPVTILICQLLELPAIPFLILEALASNIGGTATLIGDPPNIIIGDKAGLNFNHFLMNLTPAVFFIAIVFIGIALLVMRKHLKIPDHVRMRVLQSYPSEAIIDRKRMYKSLGVFGLIFIGFFIHHHLMIQPGIVALWGMAVMIIICRTKTEEMLKSVEWDAILFFIGLFIIIGSLEHCGLINKLAEQMLKVCGENKMLTCFIVLWGSAFFSAILDNIPFVIAMTPLVQKLIVDQHWFVGKMAVTTTPSEVVGSHPLFWALALGACLGGNGTLIGASANIVAAKVGERNGCKISFLEFMKYGVPVTIISIIMATVYVWIRYF